MLNPRKIKALRAKLTDRATTHNEKEVARRMLEEAGESISLKMDNSVNETRKKTYDARQKQETWERTWGSTKKTSSEPVDEIPRQKTEKDILRYKCIELLNSFQAKFGGRAHVFDIEGDELNNTYRPDEKRLLWYIFSNCHFNINKGKYELD